MIDRFLTVLIGISIVWLWIGLIGTVWVSGICQNHGYNGGGLTATFDRYCNAERIIQTPRKRIPFEEIQ